MNQLLISIFLTGTKRIWKRGTSERIGGIQTWISHTQKRQQTIHPAAHILHSRVYFDIALPDLQIPAGPLTRLAFKQTSADLTKAEWDLSSPRTAVFLYNIKPMLPTYDKH